MIRTHTKLHWGQEHSDGGGGHCHITLGPKAETRGLTPTYQGHMHKTEDSHPEHIITSCGEGDSQPDHTRARSIKTGGRFTLRPHPKQVHKREHSHSHDTRAWYREHSGLKAHDIKTQQMY